MCACEAVERRLNGERRPRYDSGIGAESGGGGGRGGGAGEGRRTTAEGAESTSPGMEVGIGGGPSTVLPVHISIDAFSKVL